MNESVIKTYESQKFNRAMNESLHPGGLDLTERMVELLDLDSNSIVLDIASGRGTTACFISDLTGCKVIGLDISSDSVQKATEKAMLYGLNKTVKFICGDVEKLPLESETFDAVICECSFSLQSNKFQVASEIHRVLKKGGKLGMSDVFLKKPMSHYLIENMPYECCFTRAETLDSYHKLFSDLKFELQAIEDHSPSMTVDTSTRLIKEYGSLNNFWDQFGENGCGCNCGGGTGALGIDYWKRLFNETDPGYSLQIWKKD